MATEKLFDVASPAAHVSVPSTLMKSQRGYAIPLMVLHSCKPASSIVPKATEAAALVSPERLTVMSTRWVPSFTLYAPELNWMVLLHGVTAEERLRGVGEPRLKSAPLLLLSIQPSPFRRSALVVVGAGAPLGPSKQNGSDP